MKSALILAMICSLCILGADGFLDSSFGNGSGYVSLPAGFYARGLVIQPDEKIVIAGSNRSDTFEIVRYENDGTPDLTFNGTGVGECGGAGIPFSVVMHPDGSLILVGQDQFNNYIKLAKYTSDGILDVAYGTGGIVVGPIGSAADAVYQLDGKLIVAGNDGMGNFLVVRYDANGAIDTTFAVGPLGFIESVKIQSDGKVLAAGTDNNGNMQLVRYSSNGTLDNTFGIGGVVTGPTGFASSLVIRYDDFCIIGGYDYFMSTLLLARYDTTGTLDPSFGVGGIVTGDPFIANNITIQGDSAIIVAGTDITNNNYTVTRYTLAGILDTSFGTSGMAIGPSSAVFNVGLQMNGDIITVGTDTTGNAYQVARYTGSSWLNPTEFSTGYFVAQPTGIVTIDGFANTPSQVFIYLDGQKIGSVNTTLGNSWSYSSTISTQGVHPLRIVSISKNNNVLSSAGTVIRIY